MSQVFVTLVILFYSVIDYTSADAKYLQILNNASCSQGIDVLNEYRYYQLNWDGGVLSPHCKLGFNLDSSISSDTHDKVCVDTYTYQITECHFTLKYYSYRKRDTIQEYSCRSSEPPRFCAEEGDTLWIEMSTSVPSDSSFQLRVRAVNTYTYKAEMNKITLYSIIGGMSLSFACLLCTIIAVVRKKYKHFRLSRITFNEYMAQHASSSSGNRNQGNVNTDEDLNQPDVTIKPPQYSEKADQYSPPPYPGLNDNVTQE
ncbi:uncharacterized protein LOC117330527 [Pecten maximus]|uniref:uncharacterized protein LOC117330527 n=1 Tax=Pecten maximus TaxID=6579 RepID=UPI00145891BD|nr:uncharacterized protein LOC117330527 [Pecten maximus]